MSCSLEELKRLTWDYLENCQVVFLATVDGDRPKVRPVTLMRKGKDLFTVSGLKSAKSGRSLKIPMLSSRFLYRISDLTQFE